MATGMHMDERSVDCLVLGHHGHDRKVSAKSVTMRAMTLCKNLSGYRELLLNHNFAKPKQYNQFGPKKISQCSSVMLYFISVYKLIKQIL